MKTVKEAMDRKTVRNVLIFIIIALASGWLGLLIDNSLDPQPNGESLGMGLWLVLPLLTTLLLRLFAGDGWNDVGLKLNIRGNIRWYVISLLIFPVVTLLVLAIGKLFGWIDFSNFRMNAYLNVFAGLLVVNFIKNFFEESVWRGYLTAKLLIIKLKDIWIYLIVGGVWGLWHLPYYLFFLPESDISQVLPVDRLSFALIAVVSMTCWSVMFVELYRITRSIWPVVLMHMMEDSLVNHLLIDGHIVIASGNEIMVSPIVGIVTSVLYLLVGLLMRRQRMNKEYCK